MVTAEDIPGDKLLSTFVHDEPVFAYARVDHIGQVLGLVVAETHLQARAAAQLAVLKVEAEQAQLNARDAQSQNATVLPRVHVARGEAQSAMNKAPHQLQGQLEIGGQEHYYLETQIAYAIPQDTQDNRQYQGQQRRRNTPKRRGFGPGFKFPHVNAPSLFHLSTDRSSNCRSWPR